MSASAGLWLTLSPSFELCLGSYSIAGGILPHSFFFLKDEIEAA
jgi:hypothetical protein